MKTTINVNGKDVVIELTKAQVDAIRKQSTDPMDYGNYEEICAAGGIDPVKDLPYQNPKTKKHVALNGAFKLMTIFDAFNFREEFATPLQEAWEPDYTDSSQDKWYSWMDWNASVGAFVFRATSCTGTYTDLGSRLCTNTQAKAKHIWTKFQKEWNEFLNPTI